MNQPDAPEPSLTDSGPRRVRSYTPAERAEAVALAAAIGPTKAAAALSVPQQTISGWIAAPAASEVIAEAERAIADRLRDAHAVALQSVLDGLRNPRSRLSDRAKALEVIGTQLALAEGRATGRIESVTVSLTAGFDEAQRLRLRRVLEEAIAVQAGDDPAAIYADGGSEFAGSPTAFNPDAETTEQGASESADSPSEPSALRDDDGENDQ